MATFRAMESGNAAAAVRPTAQLRELAAAVQGLAFPHDIAAGMAARGFVVGEPKQAVSGATRHRREAATAVLRERMASMGLG
ncbi:MAG: hypothetical protein J0L84_17395 [Verrucomicrobia bacterium]|nr:hypothetical protein [Verrucomicrobiota bacterium]